jgi:hypothetical protein
LSPQRLPERKGKARVYHDLLVAQRWSFDRVRSGELEKWILKGAESSVYGDVCETLCALRDSRSDETGSLIIPIKLQVSQGADLETTSDSALCCDRAEGTTVGSILETLAVVMGDGD